MINYKQWCRLKEMATRDHLTAAQIARALGLAARTVRKWLKESLYRPRKRVQRASVLDPFKGQIMGMLKLIFYTFKNKYVANQWVMTAKKSLALHLFVKLWPHLFLSHSWRNGYSDGLKHLVRYALELVAQDKRLS
ncbi:MAG: hypothetical protein PHP98_08510, partial [Kiritimatiellae bacterium]|nr:hypothetical protein [Kiritimatiellia bacterium]